MTSLTTVVHAIEPGDVHSTEVQSLTNDVIELWYGGGDCGDALILVERLWPVVHDGLIVIGRVQISYEVVLVLVEVVLLTCEEE